MKRSIMNVLNQLQIDFTIEELTENLIVIEKINEGLKDSLEGKMVDHFEVKGMI